MQPQGGHDHWTAIPVVAGIVDVLKARSHIDTAPEVCGLIGLHDFFTAILEGSITEEEARASISKIDLVILADGIGDEGQARAVVAAMPKSPVRP